MAISTNDFRDDLVRQIRAIGESLIKNAESIVGSERYLSCVSIVATVNASDELPSINVSRDFYPERYFEKGTDDDRV